MPKPVTYDTCPECGEPLEATAKVYLSEVVIDENGLLKGYRLAFGGDSIVDSPYEALAKSLNTDEPDELDIYCPNDHPFDLKAAKKKAKAKR